MKRLLMMGVCMLAGACGRSDFSLPSDVIDPIGEVNSFRGKLTFEMLDKRTTSDCGSRFTVYINNVETTDEKDLDSFKHLQQDSPYNLPLSVRKDGSRKIELKRLGFYYSLKTFVASNDDFEFKVKLKRIDVSPLKVKDRDGSEYLASDVTTRVSLIDVGEIRKWNEASCGIDVVTGYKYKVESRGYSKSGDLVRSSTILDYTQL